MVSGRPTSSVRQSPPADHPANVAGAAPATTLHMPTRALWLRPVNDARQPHGKGVLWTAQRRRLRRRANGVRHGHARILRPAVGQARPPSAAARAARGEPGALPGPAAAPAAGAGVVDEAWLSRRCLWRCPVPRRPRRGVRPQAPPCEARLAERARDFGGRRSGIRRRPRAADGAVASLPGPRPRPERRTTRAAEESEASCRGAADPRRTPRGRRRCSRWSRRAARRRGPRDVRGGRLQNDGRRRVVRTARWAGARVAVEWGCVESARSRRRAALAFRASRRSRVSARDRPEEPPPTANPSPKSAASSQLTPRWGLTIPQRTRRRRGERVVQPGECDGRGAWPADKGGDAGRLLRRPRRVGALLAATLGFSVGSSAEEATSRGLRGQRARPRPTRPPQCGRRPGAPQRRPLVALAVQGHAGAAALLWPLRVRLAVVGTFGPSSPPRRASAMRPTPPIRGARWAAHASLR